MEKSETNSKTPSPHARPGNRNATGKHKPGAGAPKGNQHAIGNRGGLGAPIRNKRAMRTGEYETIFFAVDIMDKKERTAQGVDYNKYVLQYLLIDTLTIREKRILQRIRAVETAFQKTGMVSDSETTTRGDGNTRYINHDSEDKYTLDAGIKTKRNDSSVVSKSAMKRIMELEDALTRVQARKQAAITQLHRMEIADACSALEIKRMAILKQRISGQMDIDALADGDDLDYNL